MGSSVTQVAWVKFAQWCCLKIVEKIHWICLTFIDDIVGDEGKLCWKNRELKRDEIYKADNLIYHCTFLHFIILYEALIFNKPRLFLHQIIHLYKYVIISNVTAFSVVTHMKRHEYETHSAIS